MRLLHTSDWHLGHATGNASRSEDHDRFFAWLEATLAQEEVDALVVAGDVFDASHPSAEAQARFFAFLARLAATGLRQAVIIAGNHDSAARLEAPAEVLRALRVHVVGAIDSTPASWERCLFPLEGRGGAVEAVALAVPYVHEYRLGVRTTDLDQAAVRASYEERFGAVYRHLADVAAARWPGLPLVATGHLTFGASSADDYFVGIHQVGHVDSLPLGVLDPRVQYTALGHIHRSYPVDPARRAWYSGTPIAFSLPEAKTPRKVLVVDLDPDPAGLPEVRAIEVPAWRRLIELRVPADALVEAVRGLRWTEPLPPLLFLRPVTDVHDPQLLRRVLEVIGDFPEAARPIYVDHKDIRATPAPEVVQVAPPALTELTPEQVFRTLCERRGVPDLPALERAFATLGSLNDDDLERFAAELVGGAR